MLVPFVIDAESIAPDPGWSPGTLRACHGALLEVWQRFGVLMHDGTVFEESALYRALPKLPQKVRSLWKAVLEAAPPIPCGTDWDGAISPATRVSAKWPPEVGFVDDTRAMVDFAFSEDEDERDVRLHDKTIDVCRLQAAGKAAPFANAKRMADSHIQADETHAQIWATRFAGLATARIKRVALVDRYAVEQHRTCPRAQLSGLLRFLKLLDRSNEQKRYVKVFSAWTKGLVGENIQSLTEDMRAAVRHLQLQNVPRLELVMVHNEKFGMMAHDRFIRFGPYAWDIGLGLDVFQGPCAGKRSSAAFKAGEVVNEYRTIEEALDASQGVKRERVI